MTCDLPGYKLIMIGKIVRDPRRTRREGKQMQRSIDHIRTTHAGSLPRPPDLTQMMWDLIDQKPVDNSRLEQRVREAVSDVVRAQVDAGIDVVSDGEMSKIGFNNYVVQRFSGFALAHQAPGIASDLADFPELAKKLFDWEGSRHILTPVVEGPIEVRDPTAVQKDIANLKAALKGRSPDDAFIPAATPGVMLFSLPNKYYPSDAAYLEAAGKALRTEYQAIVAAGFNLQLDAPDLCMRSHMHHLGSELMDPGKWIPLAIEALNEAIRGLPPEKVRLHLCWGNYPGPHHHDVEIRKIIEPVLKARVGFVYFEAANPRHAHEWEVWQDVKLPPDKALIPGVIDTATNHVEHPRLVAQRIIRFAQIVGRENVVAGTDCGFSTFVGRVSTESKIAWLKLESLVEGARIASKTLWS